MRRVPGGGDGALLEVEGRYRSLQVPQEEVLRKRWLFARGANQLGDNGAVLVQAPSRSPVEFSLPWHITSPAKKKKKALLCALPSLAAAGPIPCHLRQARLCAEGRNRRRTARPGAGLGTLNEKTTADCFLIFSFPFPDLGGIPLPALHALSHVCGTPTNPRSVF